MEVTVNEQSALGREVQVTVPAEQVNAELDKRLKEIAGQVKLPGFRPGKVPLSVVEKKYAGEVYGEVMNRLVSGSYPDALENNSLSPVAQPSIEPDNLERDRPFTYRATFEVYPDIQPTGYQGLKLTRKTPEVVDADVDKTIERLRNMRADFQTVERAAAEGDQVVVDFTGYVDGEAFEGGQAEAYTMELGGGRHLQEMEDGLIGASAGETRTVEVPFPEDYPREDLAGKTATFEVTVREVQERQLPDPEDAEFLQSFGIEDGKLETLREDVRESLEREGNERARQEVRDAILDALDQANEFDLPEQLVEQQIDRTIEQQKQQYRQQGLDPDSLNLDSDSNRESAREAARRQVKLGLLLPAIAEAEGLEVTQDEARAELERMAEAYGSQKEQFLQYVANNPDQYREVEGRALETKVIDWIIEQADVTEESESVTDLLGLEEAAAAS